MTEKKQGPPEEKNGTQQPAVPRDGFKSKQPSLDVDKMLEDVTIPPAQAEPIQTVDPKEFRKDKKLWPGQTAPPTTSESQPAAVASDGPSSSPETPVDVAGMDDDTLGRYALEECKKRKIDNPEDLMKERPDICIEVIERNLMNRIFMEKEGDGPKKAGSESDTRIDRYRADPSKKLADRDKAQRREDQEASQQNPTATQATSDEEASTAPEPPAVPSQDQSPEHPASPPSSGGGPTETDDERWLKQFTALAQLTVKQLEDQNIPLNEAIKRAEDFYPAAKEQLCSRKKLDPASIGALYQYIVSKKDRGDNVTPLEKAIFELGNLRARIDKWSRRQQSESQKVSPPASEVSVTPRPEPVQDTKSTGKPAFMMRPRPPMVEELPARKKRRNFLARLLTHRMTVAVAATAALSWAIHVRNAFNDAAITLNRLWEEVLHLNPIGITAKQVMYTFYGLIGVTALTWLYRKIKKFRRHRRFFRRLKEGHRDEYDYMINQLREIRDKSADHEEQYDNLFNAAVEDENLFYCLNLFNKTPDEATGESGAINALSKAGLSPAVISNFYTLLGSAEKRIMIARFRELAKSWMPTKKRRNKLRQLCQESPVFAEKLAELFSRDENNNYTEQTLLKRGKYTELKKIENLSGEEILKHLEQDYIEIRDDLSSGYSI